jgi:putative aldouronate transport system substrate-binding protein
MVASRELPDIIEYNWSLYPGGPEKAISDGIIIEINDLVDKYSPNFKKYLEDNPVYSKAS